MSVSLYSGIVLALLVCFPGLGTAQNVGIGTNNPQTKLHVAGRVRIDSLAGSNGIVTSNTTGDLSSTPLTGNSAHVLKGDGSFGVPTGVIPATGVVASRIYNNFALTDAGYSLFGEIPSVSSYSTVTRVFGTDTWEPTYTRGNLAKTSPPDLTAASQQIPGIALWTGSIMHVLSSSGISSYNPDTDLWTSVNNIFGNYGSSSTQAVWTGTDIILWIGSASVGNRIDPVSGTILPFSLVNGPAPRYDYSMVWTGTHLIVWGGRLLAGGPYTNTGAVYNLATNTWTTMSTVGAPAGRAFHTAIWNTATNRMIVWGGNTLFSSGELNTGGMYDPVSNTWTGATATSAGVPTARWNHSATWTGTEMIIFGGRSAFNVTNTGSKYNPVTNTWTAMSVSGAPTAEEHAATWSGSLLYVSGGLNGTTGLTDVNTYNPVANTWSFVSSCPEMKYSHHCFYKSNMLVVWGGKKQNIAGDPYSNTGYRYFLQSTSSSSTRLINSTLYLYQKN